MKIFGISLLVLIVAFFLLAWSRDHFSTRTGPCLIAPKIVIRTVIYGLFQETIPASGDIYIDPVSEDTLIVVNVDQLYRSRISIGLSATTETQGHLYSLKIAKIDTTLFEGRFTIKVAFSESKPPGVKNGYALRLRIGLSDPSYEILLPVGGFYKDTGGKWVLVAEDGIVRRRPVVLGKRSPDYFQVLHGLVPGDQVITATYGQFHPSDLSKPIPLDVLAEAD